jgi:hypothetical protein
MTKLCIFCKKDVECGCHNSEPLYDTVDEHPQYEISENELDQIIDELDKE